MKLNVDYISCLSPLRDYLFFLDKELSDFWKEIEIKDERIVPIVDTLYHHKAYDILIPLNMTVNIYMTAEAKKWWNNLIESFDSEKEVKDLTNLFYNKLSNDEERKFCDCMSDFEYFQHSNTYAIVEKTVWEICNECLPNMNNPKNGIYYCLYTGGLYSDYLTFNYLKYVDEVVLKNLFDEEKKITKEVLASPYKLALIKRTIYMYCSEFGAFYYNLVGNMVIPVISHDTVRLESNVDNCLIDILKDVVNKYSRTSFYITEHFVDNLKELYQYSEKYQFNKYTCKFLGASLPFLMQCIKKYNSAVDLSLNYINEMSLHEKADERILLALYIAMFTSDEKVQIHICNILDGIFNSEYQLNSVIRVIKDIIVFYETFTKELSMRFDIDKITELKKRSPFFYYVYERCGPNLLETGKTNLASINDSFLLSKYVFNGTITNVMNKLLSVIDDETTAYSEKLITVSSFNHLFYALASHLETEVRINITEVCRLAELDNTNYISMLSDPHELFNIYNPTQIKELKALEQRLCEAYELIPKYNTVLKYEKNLSNYFRCKLLELRKEKFGTQAKNVYVIKN